MRIMGLDYGSKTVGVAISDEMLLTAQPIETITRARETKLRQTLARIEELMEEDDKRQSAFLRCCQRLICFLLCTKING